MQNEKLKIQDSKPINFKICNLPSLRRVRRGGQSAICNTRCSGFTLLEIMIALAIIGITVTVILHTVNYHADVLYENTLTTEMFQLAKEKIHDLEISPENSKGNFSTTGFTYENAVIKSENPEIIELKTIIRGHGKEVTLSELVNKKAEWGKQKAE